MSECDRRLPDTGAGFLPESDACLPDPVAANMSDLVPGFLSDSRQSVLPDSHRAYLPAKPADTPVSDAVAADMSEYYRRLPDKGTGFLPDSIGAVCVPDGRILPDDGV